MSCDKPVLQELPHWLHANGLYFITVIIIYIKCQLPVKVVIHFQSIILSDIYTPGNKWPYMVHHVIKLAVIVHSTTLDIFLFLQFYAQI